MKKRLDAMLRDPHGKKGPRSYGPNFTVKKCPRCKFVCSSTDPDDLKGMLAEHTAAAHQSCNGGKCPNPVAPPRTAEQLADQIARGLSPGLNPSPSGLCNYHQGEVEHGRARRGWRGTPTAHPKPSTSQSESTVKTYKLHPAANLFPMLSDHELDVLAKDIGENGQHDPIIITSDNLVLDGRNRLEACRRANVEPEVQLWDREDDEISPTAWVISKNLHRRHLTPSQAAMVAADSLPMLEREAKDRQKAAGGDHRSLSAPVRQAVGVGKPPKGKAAAEAAKATGVSTRLVEQAKSVIATAPKAELEKIRSGEKTLKQVERETKLTTLRAQVKVYQPPAGEYAVISVDFSWKYDDELDGEGARGGLDYPPMTIEEICAFPIPAAPDCALFCWVTNSHLIEPDAYAVVARSLRDRYGFLPKQIRTWRKTTNDGEKERIGGGRAWRNNTEHLVRFERGRPTYNAVTQPTCFDAPRGKPSEKPQKAYDDIEALCASQSRLEMFARGERKGWVTSGSELPPKRQGWIEQAAAKAESLEAAVPVADPPPARHPAATAKKRRRKFGPLDPLPSEGA